jgi:hypothetical protein
MLCALIHRIENAGGAPVWKLVFCGHGGNIAAL